LANVVLLLGSNLGDRISYLERAINLLRERVGKPIRISSIYETAAWGNTDQNAFLNQVLELQTELSPEEVLTQTQQIETALGRIRTIHWGPREIDIDLLFYGNLVQQTPILTLPHPQLHLRRFTLLPLAEILPGLVHPVLQKTIQELLEECPDNLEAQVFQSQPK
jgi:2-amino-4-hydroxy-6-hydroxymethyldihydropteridine diphosphokinase